MARVVTPKALLQQRNALVALIRALGQEQSGGILTLALERLVQTLGVAGGLAYRCENQELVLVSEVGLPRRAKPWLAHLPLESEAWFVAQRVASTLRGEVTLEVASERMGHSIGPVLVQDGWRCLAAAPIAIGRQILGVLVLAAGDGEAFDKLNVELLDTAAQVVAFALDRERGSQRGRDERFEQARTAQLATFGLLASVVAHDLAAPLGQLEMQLEDLALLLRGLARKAGESEELRDVEELGALMAAAVTRAHEVLGYLEAFSGESKPETLDLGAVVRGAVALLQQHIDGRGISLEVTPAEGEMPVDGRQETLNMLLVQLLLYAAQESESSRVRAPTVQLTLESDASRHVVSIESSGKTEAQRSNSSLFDAFITKRKGAAPAALGLALAKQTVIAHSGHIEVGTSDLGGVLVRIVLPRSKGQIVRAKRFSSRPPPAVVNEGQPRPVVVWIEEDDLFVRSLRRVLIGHDIRSAGTIAEAKLLFASLEVTPRIVFCDVTLPDGEGVELHQALDPTVAHRFVFVTGGVIPASAADYLVRSGCPTLIKPLAIEEVAALLEQRSDEPPPSAAPTLSELPTAPIGDSEAPESSRPDLEPIE